MAQVHKSEGQIELKCDAHNFFNAWTQNTNLVTEMCPNKFHKIELRHGTSWHSLGSVKTWHYVVDGRDENLTTKVAEIDERRKLVRYEYLNGHILRNYYSNFKSQFQTIPKDSSQEGCIVKWSFEYKKMTPDAPNADIYIDFLLECAKDMDARMYRA